jgi:Uma2 family endonuclease
MSVQLRLRSEVSDIVLMQMGSDNPGYTFEREEDGSLIVSPTSTKGGAKSAEALGQLYLYAKTHGGKAFDSSTGFAIGPGVRMYAPDASWVSQPRIDAQQGSPSENGFWSISPDVVIEVKSKTDDWRMTVAKAQTFIERGSTYAVAINPQTREVAPVGAPPPGLVLDIDSIIDA